MTANPLKVLLGIPQDQPMLRLPENYFRNLGWRGAFFILASVVVTVTILLWQFGFFHWGFLRMQTKTSAEKGLRFESRFFRFEDLEIGQRVMTCVPDERWGEWARSRGYVGFGACPGRTATLEKVVVAKTGDTVRVESGGVWVNGERIRESARLETDSRGQEIRAIPEGEYRVGPREVWTMNPQGRSLDSRYYGPVPAHLVHGLSLGVIPRLPPRVDVLAEGERRSLPGDSD